MLIHEHFGFTSVLDTVHRTARLWSKVPLATSGGAASWVMLGVFWGHMQTIVFGGEKSFSLRQLGGELSRLGSSI